MPNVETIFYFKDKAARQSFLDWLSNSGEQDYWTSEECEPERKAVMCDKFLIAEDSSFVNTF